MSIRSKALFVCLATGMLTCLSPTSAKAQTATPFSVDSSLYVCATGIQVNAGQTVTITASGSVDISDMNGGYFTDPNGTIQVTPDDQSDSYSYFLNNANPTGVPPLAGTQKTIIFGGQLNGKPYGALVAGFAPTQTGGDPSSFFLVGSSSTFTAQTSGYLYLAVNDINNSYDNNGFFSASITVGGPTIASVEFTQAIQQYQTLDDLKSSLSSNNEPPVPMIANKPAVMRVYFASVTSATTVSLNVAFNNTNPTLNVTDSATSQTISLQPGCQPTDQRAHNNSCPSADFYFTPTTGFNALTLTLTDVNNNTLDTENLNFTSRTTNSLHLLGTAACDDALGLQPICGDPTVLLSHMDILNAVMPTSSVIPDITQNFVFKSFNAYATTNAWLNATKDGINALYSLANRATDLVNGSYTDYAGVYRNIRGKTGISTLPGHATLVPDAVTRLGVESLSTIQGHETGHTLGLVHTDQVTPLAPGIVFASDNDAGGMPPGCWQNAAQPGSQWPFISNYIQSNNGPEYAFNVVTQQVLDPQKNFELMAYCVPRFISPYSYKLLITALSGGSVTSPNFRSRHNIRAPGQAASLSSLLTLGNYMQVGGTISDGAVTFNPIFTDMVPGYEPNATGTYSIQEQSALGATLYTRQFTPTSSGTDVEDGPDVVFDPVFSEWLPVMPGMASIVVQDSNGNTIGNIPLTGTPPTVTLTAPPAGTIFDGPETFTWTVTGTNAPVLTSRVLYSTDSGTTWVQLAELAGTGLAPDFSKLPGTIGATALIKVLVSDGVNTGSAISNPFTVSRKTPTLVAITAPAAGFAQAAANPIQLIGYAYDPDDGVLKGAALQWSSNLQGNLGTGSPLSVRLNPGTHNITLTGTDSDGNSVSATVSVLIGGARPVLTLNTTSLSANCTSATVTAVPGSQGAALSQVQYSLDGGSTYTNIALTQLPYSFIIPGSGSINLVARAYDLTNQSAAASTFVSLGGMCSAGAPVVAGGITQTAVVTQAFAVPLGVLVSDAYSNPVSGVTVNFSAPASGPSAKLSAASAVTGANGMASVNAIANSNAGSYAVIGSVAGFSTNAQFNLTNTDFGLALDNPNVLVQHGSSAKATVIISPLSGFNSTVSLACSGLPDGVTCSFSPSSITPATSPLASVLTISAASNASKTMAQQRLGFSGGAVLALCILGGLVRRRRRFLGLLALLGLAIILTNATACGGSFASFNSSFQVTATAGTLQHTTNIYLSVE